VQGPPNLHNYVAHPLALAKKQNRLPNEIGEPG